MVTDTQLKAFAAEIGRDPEAPLVLESWADAERLLAELRAIRPPAHRYADLRVWPTTGADGDAIITVTLNPALRVASLPQGRGWMIQLGCVPTTEVIRALLANLDAIRRDVVDSAGDYSSPRPPRRATPPDVSHPQCQWDRREFN